MKKMDNQGFSLIELMLAMAMMSFVAIGALTIFSSATRSYQYSNNELNLQTEAQILINHIEERALTASNVSYDKITGTDDYLLTLYHIQYFDKEYSAVTKEDIFWIHKGTDACKNTVFLFTESISAATQNNLNVVEAELATTSSIKTKTFVKPAVEAANDEMEALRANVIAYIQGGDVSGTVYSGALSDDAEMQEIYKRHMVARGVEEFSCDALEIATGGFDDKSDLALSMKLSSDTRDYTVSDVAHLRSKIRKIPN